VALAALVAGVAALSGGSRTDPRTPAGLPGMPVPLLGVAVVGSGGRTAAVDSYGNVVDLRMPGPAGRAVVAVSPERQAAGSARASEAVVVRGRLDDWRKLPFWRADSVQQRYLPGTNVLRTEARFDDESFAVVRRVGGRGAAAADRRWLARARPLGARTPKWAQQMHQRSLLVLRALTDLRTGAVVAGARDGWAFVWPRDAGAVAIALAASGYRAETRRVVRYLLGLDLSTAARFDGTGEPIEGRDAQGDAAGWIAAAASAAHLPPRAIHRAATHGPSDGGGWRDRADYQEGDVGDYLANAIAATGAGASSVHRQRGAEIALTFGSQRGLVRVAGNPNSGLDSAAAWAVRPFPIPELFPAVRRTLLQIAARSGRFGIVPSESWHGGEDPWTAPTAWTAWALAALGERRAALRLMAALRRAATPLGLLPERVDAQSGLPTSTTPLAWSHAFAILTLRELWPGRAVS
jgi:glucoamylase